MKQSQLFGKTLKEAPKDEISVNAELLERGGFIYKNSAGVYSYLPLGWRVLSKIANIIREEIDAIGGQEMFMPVLIEKKYLDITGRWDVEISFEAKGKKEKNANFVMGWTHEEIITAIAKKYISSYKDLPFSAYQIQTKFRNEPRAKSGILRTLQFLMKDLYSFHATESDFENYYQKVAEAYKKIFSRSGLRAIYTLAGGGNFTASNTHEFQVVTSIGEDTILICEACNYAENKEISKMEERRICPKCEGRIKSEKSVEVGNIFPLGTKYSSFFKLNYLDSKGKKNPIIMGSYGIGLDRIMALAVEIFNDKKGIIWPESIAPFTAHLIEIQSTKNEVKKEAERAYKILLEMGIEVLYDDRDDKMAGEKFADADLIGIPWRLVISQKTLEKKSVEIKKRDQNTVKLLDISQLKKFEF